MMKYLLLIFPLVLSVPAQAQQTTVQQQVDSASATVMRVIASMAERINQDEAEIATLRKQNVDLIKERDETKKGAPVITPLDSTGGKTSHTR